MRIKMLAALAATLTFGAAVPGAAAVIVTTDVADFATDNVVTTSHVRNSDFVSGAPSFTKQGVTFSTIDTGGSVLGSFVIAGPNDEIPFIFLNDSAFAIFAYGSFGFDYTTTFASSTLFVNGEVVTQSLGKQPGFIGFISDDASSPTVVTIQLAQASLLGISDVLTAVPVVTPPVIDPSSPLPEPASWAMMIAGFGLVGSAMRRRKVAVSFA